MIWKLRVVVFFILSVEISAINTTITVNDCPGSVPRDSFLRVFGTSCYQFITNHIRDFTSAERECESRQGHLVIVKDSSVQNFLYNTLKNEFHFNGILWIGLTDRQSEGHHVWIDGSTPHYTYWSDGQPGILGFIEDCVAMDVGATGHWHDYRCDDILFITSEHYFVCEFRAIIPITTTTNTSPIASTTEATSATAPFTRCVQCGHLDDTTPCTEQELNNDATTQCPVNKPYCMTDVYREASDRPIKYYKRCVDETTCHLEFYLQYEKSDFCLHLNESMPDILVCHICCHGDGCNADILPPMDTLYKPPVNGTDSAETINS